MQILMLAAGESSRFWPFSERDHKAFLKIGNKTIIENVIDRLQGYDIILVINPKNDAVKRIKERYDVKLVEQDNPIGMDDAILRSKDFLKEDFLVIMPYYLNIDDYIDRIKEAKSPAVAVKPYEEGDEITHGIARIENGKITEIREKQIFEGTTHSIIGAYKLNRSVIERLENNKGKKTFEETMNDMAKESGINYFDIDQLPSLKYVTDLLNIRDTVYYNTKKYSIEKQKTESPFVEKTVILGKNVRIGNNTSIKGNTVIGDNSFIGDNSLIRDSILGENTEIGFGTEIARSIIMENTHIHSGFIGDSIIGENCRIGANFITGNRRIDRKSIRIKIKDGDYDTGMTRLGVIMGNDTKTGINVSTMPGTIVGNNCIVGSNTEIKGNINSNKLVYSKTELIEKEL